jgi:Lrp/AsnC family transcriptional regulator for asnA, asnC and gidA
MMAAMARQRPRPNTADLDPTDRAIIEELQRDGRLPFTRLGAAVGLSEAAARQRVPRLLESGVMQVVAVTNPLALAMRRMAMIGVRTEGPTDRVSASIEQLPGVEYLVVTAGSYDFLCEVVVADDHELLELTNALRSIPGVVGTETFVYLDLVKQTYEWGAR